MINLLFAGDLIPEDNIRFDLSKSLEQVLKEKDYSVVNLETPITDAENYINKTGLAFKRSFNALNIVKLCYFDSVALSNNHIRDYGNKGVRDTINCCLKEKIDTVGAGENITQSSKPLRIVIKNKKISIFNYSEKEFNCATNILAGANPFDLVDVFYDIKKEQKNSDYIIIVYHGGVENQAYPTEEIRKKFHFLVDNGVNAIISHHTHQIGGVEYYKNVPIIYSLGNFYSQSVNSNLHEWRTGMLVKIIIDNNNIGYKLYPIWTDYDRNKVELLEGVKYNMCLEKIAIISSNLQKDNFLSNYWNKHNKEDYNLLFNLISNSRLEKTIRKILKINFISKYKLLYMLNLIRCESHRTRIINKLEKLYNEK